MPLAMMVSTSQADHASPSSAGRNPTSMPTRFPTVVVPHSAACRAVHLRSWTAGRWSGYGLRSPLNGRERR
jgi:hypothetical protein